MRKENGFYIWNRGEDAPVGTLGHFSTLELACHCNYTDCVEQRVSEKLINRLENVRLEYDAPIFINRAYSCLKHQADLVGAGLQAADPAKSMHPKGEAADIRARLMTKLVPIVERYFQAIGLAPTWLHCDTRPKDVRWTYTK